MKVAIECHSPLLQKSLENFLQGFQSSIHSCDIIVSDHDIPNRSNVLRIGSDDAAHIKKPFSKSQLLLKLEHYYKTEQDAIEVLSIADAMEEEPVGDFSLDALEEKIERLTRQYTKGLMSLIKEHYEKR